MNVIEVNDVSKMFRLGAHTGDLRDRFNALFAREKAAADRKAQEFWALRDISFSVAEGESFGIIGHNGSGKSTLLKLITGIYKPTTGTFKTQGRIAALIEVGAGFHPDLTGRENVYLNGSVLGMSRRDVDRKFDEIVDFAELEKFIDTPVKRYSSGMYMRLGFAIAAHINPDIVLVDEVLAVGDESFQAKCMAKMHSLRASGKTIVFISHSMGAVAELCQRVMLLSHGHLVDIGEPRAVISTYRSMVAVEESQKGKPAATVAKLVAPTKEIKLLEFRLLDAAGRPCDTVASGETVTLECDYRADARVDDPVFGMSVRRHDGLAVYAFNTRYDRLPVRRIERGPGRYKVTFPALGLLAGEYHFNVDVSRPDDDIPDIFPLIDAQDKALTFNVTAEKGNGGVVHMPHRWDFDEQSSRSVGGEATAPRDASALTSSRLQ